MKIICKREPLGDDGNKIMAFTKGNTYHAKLSTEEGTYYVIDDNMDEEEFFRLDILFEIK